MNVGFALRLLWRDWRAGELTLLLAALVVAVGTVTTITLFADRLQRALLSESSTFLAGDRVISGSKPIPDAVLATADRFDLESSQTLEFLSMVFADESARFASVKAVSGSYPLRGKLITSDRPFEGGVLAEGGPAPGTVWLESRLIPSLGVSVGDELEIGVATLVVARVLLKEPDRGGGFNNTGPRVMMHLDDVAATEVVQPGSRLTYKVQVTGTAAALSLFEETVAPSLKPDFRIYGVKEGTDGIGKALERAERFLLLGGLLGVVLAGIAIALSAQRYSLRHYDHVAILKTHGATPMQIDFIFITIFAVLGLSATLLGSVLGFGAQMAVVSVLEPFIPIALPPPGARPIVIGAMTGLICLFAFALPPILKLRSTDPNRVIRRDIEDSPASATAKYASAAAGTFLLMWWYSEDWFLSVLVFAGSLAALVVLGGIAWLMLHSGRALGMQAGSVWRLALAGMQRRGQENTVQILAFGLAIMLLLILALVRTALIDEWEAQIPENAPNHFVINISPEDVAPIEALLAEEAIEAQPLFAMIRGRITTVNGESASERDRSRQGPDRGPRTGSERNLTALELLPKDNRVVSGQWWDGKPALPEVSLEKDYADSNGLKVGDTLVFTIQGRELETTVSSVRTVAWDNMQPNFYIILSPGALDPFPATYITSFHLDKANKLFLNEFLATWPTVTVIEIDMIIEQIQTIIAQVTMAIELVLVLILMSGAIVLLASVQASMDERFRQHAILRTLGASQRLVMGSLAIEFCALGLFAGMLATVGSEITVYGLQTEIFELDYSVHPWLWGTGPLVGIVLIGTIGMLATRRVVNTPPSIVLREL